MLHTISFVYVQRNESHFHKSRTIILIFIIRQKKTSSPTGLSLETIFFKLLCQFMCNALLNKTSYERKNLNSPNLGLKTQTGYA